MAVLPEAESIPSCGDEPKEHVRQQHPDCVLHPGYALVAFGIFRNIHLSEDTKRNEVADKDEEVDEEEEPRLHQVGHHGQERHDGTQGSAYNGPYPL